MDPGLRYQQGKGAAQGREIQVQVPAQQQEKGRYHERFVEFVNGGNVHVCLVEWDAQEAGDAVDGDHEQDADDAGGNVCQ